MIVILAAATALAQHPAGADIDPAVSVQISQTGLDAVGGLAGGFIPTDALTLDDTSGGVTCFQYSLSNATADVTVDDIAIALGGNNQLMLDADLTVSLNDAGNPFEISFEIFCGGETCPGYVEPFPVNVNAPIALGIGTHPDGNPVLTATVGNLNVNSGLNQFYTELDCTTGIIEDLTYVLNLVGIDLYDLIIDAAIGPLKDELQAQLDEALLEARFADQFDVLGTPLDIEVYPSFVEVKQYGVDLQLMGRFDAPQADCVAAYDTEGGSLLTASDVPALTSNPADAQVAAHVADDFLNQAMYAVWRGGALCYEVQEGDLPGFAVDSSLLPLLAGESYEEFVPETPAPLVIRLDPKNPPTVVLDGAHDVDLSVEDLGLNFFTEVDGRMARALAMELDVEAGADLLFDENTGQLEVLLDLGPDAFTAAVGADVMIPGAEEAIAENFSVVLVGLVDTLVGSLLGDALAFGLPNLSGQGVVGIDVDVSGDDADWLALYAEVGPVSYGDPDAGCACDGGDSGCGDEGGCSVGGSGPAWLFLMPLLALRRRRHLDG